VKNTHDNSIATAATLATLLSCLTIVPLVKGLSWLFAVTVVVVAIAVAGAVVRPMTRWWVLVALAQLAVMLVTVTVLFVPDAAVFGVLPGRAAITALVDLFGDGMSVVRDQSPPVENTRGVQLVLALGLGGIALVVDLIAVSLRRPAVAGLPLLAVYCLPSALLPDGLKWYWFVPAALGFLALVATDAADRVRAWGRVLGDPEHTGERPSGLWLWPATGGGRAAVTAVGLAVIVPAALPGLGTSLLPGQGFGDSGQGRSGNQVHMVNPILDLRRDLSKRSNDVAFRYRTTRPGDPIRLVANEAFDGTTWAPSEDLPPAENTVAKGMPKAPGLGGTVTTQTAHTDVSVATLDQRYLPVSYPPTRIVADGSWLYDSGTFNIVGKGTTTKNLDYSFDYLAVQPKPSQLQTAIALPANTLASFTRLPDYPEVIKTTAAKVAGSGTSYERAVRLQNWFRSGGGFTYSVQAPGNGANDAGLETMVAFLEQRTGYCVHFASAMAVMARSLGIPARVAVGFLPGVETDTPGQYAVTYARAHAWPELYFEGAGWVRFEPTPASQSGTVPSWTIPTSETPTTDPKTPATEKKAASPGEKTADDVDTADEAHRNTALVVLDAVPWRGVALLVVLMLLLGSPRARVAWLRSRQWRKADSRIERAEVGWAQLRQRLSDLRVSWPASRTPRAVEAFLTGEYMLETEEQAALSRLVSDIEGARYAPPWSSAGRPVTAIQDDVRLVAEGVAASQPRSVRRRAQWFPPSAFERSAPQALAVGDGQPQRGLISRR
jgi:transglutaminase-like putative cysteine protease